MKHEMVEAELHVWPSLFDVLIRIARHEPATVRLGGDRFGEAFHLARVSYPQLDVAGEGEGRPDPRRAWPG